MKYLPLSLLLLPLMSFQTRADDKDLNITITAQGSIGQERRFESLGNGRIYSADTLLQDKGGYDKLYAEFERTPSNRLSVSVWQKAQAFQNHLKDCNIDVPVDALLMRIGHDAIFKAQNQEEINNIVGEMGQHLSFERKINFIAQVGASLNAGYDFNDRDDTPIVTMMDMVKARQTGGKAGVCRDMHLAMADIMVKMGVSETYIVATQVVGGGHAVLIAQDPNDPSKSYMVNYGRMSSQQSADPTAHLMLNTSIPSIGVNYRIYAANGKPLTTLPSGLGLLLNDFLGKSPTNLDPMARSQNSFARAELGLFETDSSSLAVSLGAGQSSDGDKVIALSGNYATKSEHFPMEFNFSLYNSRRDSAQMGQLTANGIYFDGVQHVRVTPVQDAPLADGKVTVEVLGRIGVRGNFVMASEEKGDKNAFSAGSDVYAAAGSAATYQSNDGKTNVRAGLEAVFAMDKADVRNETLSATTFDLRNVTGSLVVSREIARSTSGYRVGAEAGATVVMRPGLGVQSSQQLSLNVVDDKGRSASLGIRREGQVQGPTLSFLPGSMETYSVEATVADRNRNSVSGSVFCTTYQDRRSCGTRATGRIRF